MNYLDFEEPIKDLDKQLSDCIELGDKSDVDVSETRIKIQKKIGSNH
jgi:acetyl-CoA carboxylase carboxyl transferase subunit alpha